MAQDVNFCVVKNGRGSVDDIIAAYVYRKWAVSLIDDNAALFNRMANFRVISHTEDKLVAHAITPAGEEPFSLEIVELTGAELNEMLSNRKGA